MRLFPWWHRLPLRSDEVDGLASPYTSLWLIAICWGDQTSLWGAADLVAMVPIRRRKLPGASLSAGGLVLFRYLFMKYRRLNGSLSGSAYPLARS
jgi:hypothetical protein